jgi:hypothetical protein
MNQATIENMSAKELLAYVEQDAFPFLTAQWVVPALCKRLRESLDQENAKLALDLAIVQGEVDSVDKRIEKLQEVNNALTEQLEIVVTSLNVHTRDIKNILTKHKL